jgi:hypothetical protein
MTQADSCLARHGMIRAYPVAMPSPAWRFCLPRNGSMTNLIVSVRPND